FRKIVFGQSRRGKVVRAALAMRKPRTIWPLRSMLGSPVARSAGRRICAAVWGGLQQSLAGVHARTAARGLGEGALRAPCCLSPGAANEQQARRGLLWRPPL